MCINLLATWCPYLAATSTQKVSYFHAVRGICAPRPAWFPPIRPSRSAAPTHPAAGVSSARPKSKGAAGRELLQDAGEGLGAGKAARTDPVSQRVVAREASARAARSLTKAQPAWRRRLITDLNRATHVRS